MLELLNQMDGFDALSEVKVRGNVLKLILYFYFTGARAWPDRLFRSQARLIGQKNLIADP